MDSRPFDAILVVSFGGPEGPDDVIPFLENVLRGKNVPRARMLAVAEHYQHFGGVSPINAQNRALIEALRVELETHGLRLPIYWGNRNWQPLLPDTLRQMASDGVQRALGFFTSAYSSYSGCRQYREDIERAQAEVGPAAPRVEKLRAFYNHPGYIAATIERVRAAVDQFPIERRAAARLIFTAHSIPLSMAQNCRYEAQLREACRLVATGLEHSSWALAFQSRSGPPSQPWLEPDIGDYLRGIASDGFAGDVVLMPIGFISDHMEVLFDLDTEAADICRELRLNMIRAATVGTHPRFVQMIRELIVERVSGDPARPVLGGDGPCPDVCAVNCCLSGATRPAGSVSQTEPRT